MDDSVTRSLAYALLFSVPAGTAIGSGIWLMTRETTYGLAIGLVVGVLVFALVYLGRERGSGDESLAEGP